MTFDPLQCELLPEGYFAPTNTKWACICSSALVTLYDTLAKLQARHRKTFVLDDKDDSESNACEGGWASLYSTDAPRAAFHRRSP